MSIMSLSIIDIYFFFFNDTATTEIYTLSLHDALPISVNLYGVNINFLISARVGGHVTSATQAMMDSYGVSKVTADARDARSEEHTSELQSRQYLVCRLLLEKKKK